MILRKAQRQRARMRIGFSAVSGGGKTISSLLTAYGMTGDWNKIALIDSESGRGELYAGDNRFNIGEYNYIRLDAPYTPESYIKAIKMCEDKSEIEVIIIDSITHEWSGKGGCIEIQSALGGRYQDWANVTPRHQKFIDAILSSRCHMITTVRRKTEYDMSKDSQGKMIIEKGGLKEVTREDFEYELTVNLQLDIKHNATVSKDNTGLFDGHPEFIPSIKTGKMLRDWCELGIDPIKNDPYTDLNNCTSLDELQKVWLSLSSADQAKYLALKDTIKLQLMPPPPAPEPPIVITDQIALDLLACKTLSALKKAWDAIPAEIKPDYLTLKDSIKESLTVKK
jgi:hypothetical protein